MKSLSPKTDDPNANHDEGWDIANGGAADLDEFNDFDLLSLNSRMSTNSFDANLYMDEYQIKEEEVIACFVMNPYY